ncbi:MAG: macro domain-containing protein [Polyangiales bacterium]
MKMILAAVEPSLAEAWRDAFAGVPAVTVVDGSILEQEVDAVVSPANSFGYMDGGVDLEYSVRFGWGVQGRLQERIARRHHGELPVGCADILETFREHPAYLVAAPTMRVPMRLDASVNAYLATRAALLLVLHGVFPDGDFAGRPVRERVASIAFPGMGTGVGAISHDRCARQMRAAWDACVAGADFPPSIYDATDDHEALLR